MITMILMMACHQDDANTISSHIADIDIKLYTVENDSVAQTEVRIDDISGEYEMIQGTTHIVDGERNEIFKAAIVIDRISDTDFGFYAASKVNHQTPIGDFGVLRNIKNRHYNLGICNSDDELTESNFARGIYIHNQVIILTKGDLLAIIRYGYNYRSYLLYKKKETHSKFFKSLINTLEDSRKNYLKFLTEYNRALNYDKNKLEIEYIFENNGWKTKHHHKEKDESYTIIHSYQDPDENGNFDKTDSVFLSVLYQY